MRFFKLLSAALLPLLCVTLLAPSPSRVSAQAQQAPLTNEEFLTLVRQIPKNPGARAQVIEALKRRGIAFPLTAGLRSVVATKSGNDADLRRALEEAERRRLNPSAAAALPTEAEAEAVLNRARAAAAEASEQMPDFVVKQLVTRALAQGTTRNWVTSDRLVVAVSFRVQGGEQYRLLAVNGVPGASDGREAGSYEQAGGATSTGEFVSVLAQLFRDDSKTEFKAVDTDTLAGRPVLVYEYRVKRLNSKQTISAAGVERITTGHRGRLWIDRDSARVLRIESDAEQADIPAAYPVRAARRRIDYDWVTIAERPYLLPSRSVVELTVAQAGQHFQSRNDIRFRNYQKYGTEIKVIEEDIIEDEPAEKKP